MNDFSSNFKVLFVNLAAFCGRYDFVLTLLNKGNASPFVRDYIQLKNLFDYLEIDANHKECQLK
jgi:hypothetical protein